MAELALALAAVPCRSGCAGPWGLALFALDESEPGVERVQVLVGSARPVAVGLVAATHTTRWLREDPRAHNQGILAVTPSGLRLMHASDTSESAPLDFAEMARVNLAMSGRPREGALVLLVNGGEPVAPVLAALRGAEAAVSWVALPLE